MTRALVASMVCLSACAASLPGPELSAVEPAVVKAEAATAVVLRGSFRAAVRVDFDSPRSSTRDVQFSARAEQGPGSVSLTQVRWVDAETLAATVPQGLAPGVWGLEVTDPQGAVARRFPAFEVLECPVTDGGVPEGGFSGDAGPAAIDAGVDDAGVDGGTLDDAGSEEDAGPPDAGPTPCGLVTFADDDGDGVGRNGSQAMLCGPGRVSSGGDCDDVDPATFPGSLEVCNRVDDDCNGAVDEAACAILNPNWIRRLDGRPGNVDWATASVFGPGQVWIAGQDAVWLRADGGTFEPASASCPANLRASWAAPGGDGFFAGGGAGLGRLTTHPLGAGGCNVTRMLTDEVAGLFGEQSQVDGGLLIGGALRNTRTFAWTPPGQPIELPSNLPATTRFEDAHRVGADAFFAVGSDSQTNAMKVFQFVASTRQWREEPLSRLGLPSGSLRGVWVRSATSVFAVGDQGVVIEKTPPGWRRVPGLDGGSMTSVRAFSSARIYATDAEGRVRKFDGRLWRLLFAADAGLTDLAGTSEGDLWAVGRRGLVLHWPE